MSYRRGKGESRVGVFVDIVTVPIVMKAISPI